MNARFLVTIELSEEMGVPTPQAAKDIMEEALRDSGIDNGIDYKVELIIDDNPIKAV